MLCITVGLSVLPADFVQLHQLFQHFLKKRDNVSSLEGRELT